MVTGEESPANQAMVVDVDDPSTWPPAVLKRVQTMFDKLRGSSEFANELNVPSCEEDEFRSLLSGHFIRVYHATRLLDHEISMIRTQGLRPLSAKPVDERIDAAFDHSCISEEERGQLHASHVYAIGEEEGRDGKCCFIFPASTMAEHSSGINPLLAEWGGEAISMFNDTRGIPGRLARLGTPSVVVASIDMSPGLPSLFVHPGTLKMFIGRFLTLDHLGAEAHSQAPVPPHRIEAIRQPGDADYDQYVDLVSS